MSKCLVLERHHWETGKNQQQIQMPKEAFEKMFGKPRHKAGVNLNLTLCVGPFKHRIPDAEATPYLRPSQTFRINGVPNIGVEPSCFVFLQQLDRRGGGTSHEMWFRYDKAFIVHFLARNHSGMKKAKDSQFGRGRLWAIVDGVLQKDLGTN